MKKGVYNVSHIVANGCSYTYGEELDVPSKQSWPALLAQKMNMNLVNIARPGSGNDGILRRTIEYYYYNLLRYNSTPLFVIALSFHTRREEYFSYLQDYKHLIKYENIEDMDDAERYFFLNSEDCVRHKEKLFQWLHLINFFRINDIPYIIGDYMPDIEHFDLTPPPIVKLLMNDERYCGLIPDFTRHLPKKPEFHDGEEAQEVVANLYHDYINKNYELSITDSKYLRHDEFFTKKQLKGFKDHHQHHWIGT